MQCQWGYEEDPHQIASHAMQIVRKGHATPEGTAFYRMGMSDLYSIGQGHWRVTQALSESGGSKIFSADVMTYCLSII